MIPNVLKYRYSKICYLRTRAAGKDVWRTLKTKSFSVARAKAGEMPRSLHKARERGILTKKAMLRVQT